MNITLTTLETIQYALYPSYCSSLEEAAKAVNVDSDEIVATLAKERLKFFVSTATLIVAGLAVNILNANVYLPIIPAALTVYHGRVLFCDTRSKVLRVSNRLVEFSLKQYQNFQKKTETLIEKSDMQEGELVNEIEKIAQEGANG